MTTVNSDAAHFVRLENEYGANNYDPLDIVLQRGEGVWVWDIEGNKYLDFLAAYSAVNQGHVHPKIRQALLQQIERMTLTSRAFRTDQLGPLYKTLHDMSGYKKMLPYKVKGVADGQAEILVFKGNFHGRTTTIVGFSDEDQYRDGFGPFTPGFTVLPYGDIDAVRGAMNPNVAAVLVEPIQGESGIIIPPDGYLKGIEAACREHRALFIVDEIQSGLGRTGKLFAFEHEGVRPDIVIVGKALAGGFYPVSGILADDDVMSVFNPGDHGSTFGGNPLGAAVARAALEVLVEENMIENSARLGEYFVEQLKTIDSRWIKEVRGRGLWIGVELVPEAGGARRFCEALAAKGLLCKETHEHTIRFAPPLSISRDDLDWAFERIEAMFKELA